MIKKLFLNNKFILGLILLNSVILFLSGYIATEGERITLNIADHTITVLFIIEMFVKFKEYGLSGYFHSRWNRFDFFLVILSLPALIVFIFDLPIMNISFLLIFRNLRIFKSFRFFKFIPNIEHLASGVKKALKSSIFVIIGFSIYIFIIGMLSYYLFRESPSGYFKTPMLSLYSIFKIFTVEGWFEIPEQLILGCTKTVAFFTYLYFIFIVLTGGIFGLSLVNSIFVDSMLSDNNNEIEEKIDEMDSKINKILEKLDKQT